MHEAPARKMNEAPARKLSEREERMVALRWQGYTLQAIGDLYGITRERVRQLLRRAGVNTARPIYTISCQVCGQSRRIKPQEWDDYVQRGIPHICNKCRHQRISVTCPRCGRTRQLRPRDYRKLRRFDGLCQQCYRANVGEEIWGGLR